MGRCAVAVASADHQTATTVDWALGRVLAGQKVASALLRVANELVYCTGGVPLFVVNWTHHQPKKQKFATGRLSLTDPFFIPPNRGQTAAA